MSDHFMKWLKAYAAAISIPLGVLVVWLIETGLRSSLPPEVSLAIKAIISGFGVAAVPSKDG